MRTTQDDLGAESHQDNTLLVSRLSLTDLGKLGVSALTKLTLPVGSRKSST